MHEDDVLGAMEEGAGGEPAHESVAILRCEDRVQGIEPLRPTEPLGTGHEVEVVVSEHGHEVLAERARPPQHRERVRPAIHEIAHEPESIATGTKINAGEQSRERGKTPLHVADGIRRHGRIITWREPKRSDTFAAVDLGSNSFHMKIARLVHDEVHEVDRLRERVQIAAGLQEDKTLSNEALDRAYRTLELFGERLRDIPPKQVRAVGTNTLRQVKRPRAVLERASEALGHHVEIISGQEEARLIFLGVSHSLPFADERRLVVDIGGGSTECIIGEGFEPSRTASLFMGCVSFTLQFFPDGAHHSGRHESRRDRRPGGARDHRGPVQEPRLGARLRLFGYSSRHRHRPPRERMGPAHHRQGTEEARRKALVEAGRVSKLSLAGLTSDRAQVFPGGVAILKSIFDGLEPRSMDPANGALREGVLYDLIGRVRHEDVRERTIQRLVEQYRIDTVQAERVERTALAGLKQLKVSWDLEDPAYRQLLIWASRLHEIGITISYSGYHRHGAYIVANSELPGFSRDDQSFLAALIETHRERSSRGLRGAHARIPGDGATARHRAAHRRPHQPGTGARVRSRPSRRRAAKKQLSLGFPHGWVDRHPLTRTDLEQEAKALKKVGYELTFS